MAVAAAIKALSKRDDAVRDQMTATGHLQSLLRATQRAAPNPPEAPDAPAVHA